MPAHGILSVPQEARFDSVFGIIPQIRPQLHLVATQKAVVFAVVFVKLPGVFARPVIIHAVDIGQAQRRI